MDRYDSEQIDDNVYSDMDIAERHLIEQQLERRDKLAQAHDEQFPAAYLDGGKYLSFLVLVGIGN